jgi:hypothetical protein
VTRHSSGSLPAAGASWSSLLLRARAVYHSPSCLERPLTAESCMIMHYNVNTTGGRPRGQRIRSRELRSRRLASSPIARVRDGERTAQQTFRVAGARSAFRAGRCRPRRRGARVRATHGACFWVARARDARASWTSRAISGRVTAGATRSGMPELRAGRGGALLREQSVRRTSSPTRDAINVDPARARALVRAGVVAPGATVIANSVAASVGRVTRRSAIPVRRVSDDYRAYGVGNAPTSQGDDSDARRSRERGPRVRRIFCPSAAFSRRSRSAHGSTDDPLAIYREAYGDEPFIELPISNRHCATSCGNVVRLTATMIRGRVPHAARHVRRQRSRRRRAGAAERQPHARARRDTQVAA